MGNQRIYLTNWHPRTVNDWTLVLAICGTAAGFAARLGNQPSTASLIWAITTGLVLLPLTASIVSALRQRKLGVDVIALLAMTGALILGQYLAGVVIALMLSGGQALEQFADARARRELSGLLQRAPRLAHRCHNDEMTTVPIEDVGLGDLLLVKPGEVVPVDGVVVGTTAVLDEAALTGEAVPVEHREGEQVRSGAVNAAGGPFRLRVTALARDSTYTGIVRLVEQAQAAKAPMIRLADRYSMILLPFTLTVAAAAWLVSGEPVRALAVLVVATPCPLILAAPIAIISGLSRAARRGIIIKGGGALETLARGRMLVLDKTGTVTGGSPVITDVESFGNYNPDQLLQFAASLDQISPHVLAGPILQAARERGLALFFPTDAHEELGSGIRGFVNGHFVELGRSGWVLGGQLPSPQLRRLRRRTAFEGSSSVTIAIDRKIAGALVLEDPIRPDALLTLRSLRRAGFQKIFLLTGDHEDVAKVVGSTLGIDRIFAERSPAEKVAAVAEARREGITVMVGDGVNDAPSLAAADVGVALGARGATASSEAADVVLVVDRLQRLVEGVGIARRARGIAVQSIVVGMSLSGLGMGMAALGLLPPVGGALLQEVIDLLVILNALRALQTPGRQKEHTDYVEISEQIRTEHRHFLPGIQQIRQLADRLDTLLPEEARLELAKARRFLLEQIVPHDQLEEEKVYPLVAKVIGGTDPTTTMGRSHLEVSHLVDLFRRTVDELPPEGPDGEDIRELRRILYGLHAILKLHFAQEEESYLTLLDGITSTQPQGNWSA
ncbi:MAG: heavy metal translocating P-type ATPase [Acidobacteriaceae bacterium]|nr:heavy metal translocating P-type ATPase [Acidobacteriaceae bacterium]